MLLQVFEKVENRCQKGCHKACFLIQNDDMGRMNIWLYKCANINKYYEFKKMFISFISIMSLMFSCSYLSWRLCRSCASAAPVARAEILGENSIHSSFQNSFRSSLRNSFLLNLSWAHSGAHSGKHSSDDGTERRTDGRYVFYFLSRRFILSLIQFCMYGSRREVSRNDFAIRRRPRSKLCRWSGRKCQTLGWAYWRMPLF